MELEALQKRLMEAHAKIGFTGRFAFTIDQKAGLRDAAKGGDCYITHWFRPTPHAFEDCKAVGAGTLAECLSALDRYVDGFNSGRKMTQAELAATLGIEPIRVLESVD